MSLLFNLPPYFDVMGAIALGHPRSCCLQHLSAAPKAPSWSKRAARQPFPQKLVPGIRKAPPPSPSSSPSPRGPLRTGTGIPISCVLVHSRYHFPTSVHDFTCTILSVPDSSRSPHLLPSSARTRPNNKVSAKMTATAGEEEEEEEDIVPIAATDVAASRKKKERERRRETTIPSRLR